MYLILRKNKIAGLKCASEAGMTFLELIVVMGIFAAISATVLFNYRDFSTNVALQNLAQDIALQIKQAQTDAVSGRIPVFPAASNQGQPANYQALIPAGWKPSFGVAFQIDNTNGWDLGGGGFAYYFNKGAPPLPGNLEVDRDFYDFTYVNYDTCGTLAPGDSECLQEINITSGDTIDMLCFDFTNIADTCDGVSSPTNQAFISFTRPRGNAVIMDGATADDGTSHYGRVYIGVRSSTGSHKYISVWESGYISVK